jgi:hypothetical protein
MIHYRVQKSPLLVSILSRMNSVTTSIQFIRSILIIFFNLSIGLPSFPFLYLSLPKFCMHATCPQCVLHALTIPSILTSTTFGEEHELWSSSLCSFFRSPTISALLGSNFPLVPCSETLSDYFSLWCQRPSFTPIRK